MPPGDCTGDQVGRYGNRMADPWTFAGPVIQLDSSARVVTLVDESTFAISGGAGDIAPGAAQGLFFRDTRILSRFELLVNGPEPNRWRPSPTTPSRPPSCPGACPPRAGPTPP